MSKIPLDKYTQEELGTLIKNLKELDTTGKGLVPGLCNYLQAFLEVEPASFSNNNIFNEDSSIKPYGIKEMFIPVEDIFLLFNHTDPIIKCIAKWRFTIAK